MVMPALATSIANAGLPTLSGVFGAAFQQVQWIVLAYLLTNTALVVGAGRLGDIFGRRRMLLAGIGLFTMASIVCGSSPTIWILVAARAAQGLGASAMLALAVALVSQTVPNGRMGRAMGLLGTLSAVGTALGAPLGGGLIAAVGWQAIFWINLPLGIVCYVLAHRFIARDLVTSKADRVSFDGVGTLTLALSLAAIALALTMGGGRFSPVNGFLLLTALVGVVLFVKVERRAKSPLISLDSLADRALSGSLAMNSAVAAVMMSTLVVGPFYLSQALGLPPAAVGVALSVGPIVAALVGVPAGRLVDRFGPQTIMLAGLAGMALGAVALSLGRLSSGLLGYLVPIATVTAGYALFQAANNTAVMSNVAADQRGAISGLINVSRNLGLFAGASVMGAIFAYASMRSAAASGSREAIDFGMRITFAAGLGLVTCAVVIANLSQRARPWTPLRQGNDAESSP